MAGVAVGVVAGTHRPGAESRQRRLVEQRIEWREAAGAFGPAAERVVDHDQVVLAGGFLQRLVPERLQRASLPHDGHSGTGLPALGARPHRRHAAGVIPAQRAEHYVAQRTPPRPAGSSTQTFAFIAWRVYAIASGVVKPRAAGLLPRR